MTARHCASCGAAIIWAKTEAGKAMPVDAEAVDWPDTGNIVLSHTSGALVAQVRRPGPGLRKPHFATCPHPRRWKGRR